ncbi:hypothetical protein JOC34_000447 [Virgibacillus halotolerans]|nr:hypothetical protein [Virgibacillus halotolerans]
MAGYPIDVGGIKVWPLTLREVLDIGEKEHSSMVSIFLVEKDSLVEEGQDLSGVYVYHIIHALAINDHNIRDVLLNAMGVMFKEDVSIDEDGFFIYKDGVQTYITPEQFEEIREVIRIQNYLGDDSESEGGYKPANSKAQEYADRIAKMKDKLRKDKGEDKGLALHDLASIVSTHSNNINLLNVWDLTIYQLYENYIRLMVWDDYHSTHMHIPHMEEKDIKKMKHWATPVDLDTLRRKN